MSKNEHERYHNTAELIESSPVTHSRSLLAFKTKPSTLIHHLTSTEPGDKGLVVQLDYSGAGCIQGPVCNHRN